MTDLTEKCIYLRPSQVEAIDRDRLARAGGSISKAQAFTAWVRDAVDEKLEREKIDIKREG